MRLIPDGLVMVPSPLDNNSPRASLGLSFVHLHRHHFQLWRLQDAEVGPPSPSLFYCILINSPEFDVT